MSRTRADAGAERESAREDTDPLALESQVCFAITRASRGIVAAYRPVLEPLRLTHPQYLVMLALWQESPLSLKELSSRLALDPGTLSPLVKRLEATGYLERTRASEDERSLAIVLTDSGRALRERAKAVPGIMRERLGMDEAEVQALHAGMMKVVELAARSEQGATAEI
ncbi:MarR family winged helix-turn-helix transcriptional regulator [Brachybacterium kimchii]|uniref:MarR family transcriptional regulator n=1 Tax=Brachybacterium kimchii TaxID=2942909 RepID=A0ABY4NBZ5_9MICO|nr:MarR family transcriptional regulator [Brachybacterium kimchii]UQN31331.1 MarR family transcriptional regulator [Brachybacterium kimchii]